MRSHDSVQAGQYGPADEVLLSEVRQGKLESFGVLYERYISMGRAIAYRHTANQTLSEDLVAEAFMRILQALKNGKGPHAFMGGYLATTIAHLAAEHGLLEQKEVPSEAHYLESVGSLDESVLKLHESDELISAFTSLPERWQSVLWMTEVENKKPREIAATLDLSANAVSALAARARESLREGFLRAHQHAPQTEECSQYSPYLSPMVRGSLTKKRSETLRAHLSTCSFCSAEYLNLLGVNKTMRTWVFPVLAGLTPILTDSSKLLAPYLAGGSALAVGASQSGASGLSSVSPGRWASGSQTLVGAAAAVTAIGAVVGGVALFNSSSPQSAVVSADSQLESPSVRGAAEASAGVTDAIVDSPQSPAKGLPAESLEGYPASESALLSEAAAAGTETSSQGAKGDGTTLERVSAGASDESAPVRTSFTEGVDAPSLSSGASTPALPKAGVQNDTADYSAGEINSVLPSFPQAGTDVAGDTGKISVLEPSGNISEAKVSPDAQNEPVASDLEVPQEPREDHSDPGGDNPVVPVERTYPADPNDPVSPTEPADPDDAIAPSDPVAPEEPEEPAQPSEPADPIERTHPVDPSEPADPSDPADPVVPSDPEDPSDPDESTTPIAPSDPADPSDPVDPADPADPTTPVVPDDPGVPNPKDWVGTPEYYEWMSQVPWDTIGSPVNDNRMCVITAIYSDSLVSFGTYIPQIILESPYVFYVLESYFELEAITQITCY